MFTAKKPKVKKLSKLLCLIFIFLVLYSLAMVISEIAVSRDFVRYFFTDITNPLLFDSVITIDSNFARGFLVRLFGVNTTLCVLLLWTCCILFACRFFIAGKKRVRTFALIQMILFAYLALDERFLFHELIGVIVGINDAFVLLIIGIAELAVLFHWRDVWLEAQHSGMFLLFAAFFFFLMILIDAFIHSPSLPRLAAEDLFKLWACFSLLFFSITIFITYVKNKIEEID